MRRRRSPPAATSRGLIRQTVDDLVDRLFGGETLPLVQHLIEERGLSDQDLRQLRELLDPVERRHGGDA